MTQNIFLLISILFLCNSFTNTMAPWLQSEQKYHAGAAGAAGAEFVYRARPTLPDSEDDGYKSLNDSDTEDDVSPYQKMTLIQLNQHLDGLIESFERVRIDARANYESVSFNEDFKKLKTGEDYFEDDTPEDQLTRAAKEKAKHGKAEFQTLELITNQALKLHREKKENLPQQNQVFKDLFVNLIQRFETLKEMLNSDPKTNRKINLIIGRIEGIVSQYYPE